MSINEGRLRRAEKRARPMLVAASLEAAREVDDPGERRTIAAMVAAARAPASADSCRPRLRRRRLAASLVAATIGALLAGGGLAVAGSLPGHTQSIAHGVLHHIGVHVPDHHPAANHHLDDRTIEPLVHSPAEGAHQGHGR